jgi:glycosyltransferase involved in cell wall biosynthesis
VNVGLAIETDIPGGAETMQLELARQLTSRGHRVVPIGPKGPEGWLTSRFAELGIKREQVDLRGLVGLVSVPQIVLLIRSHRLDVLHSHEFGMAVYGSLAARLTGCRHIMTMHGGTYYAGRARRRRALRVAASLSDHTVTVSNALRRSFSDAVGISAERVDVVHNGVTYRAGDGRRVRGEMGLAPRDVLVLAVGNLLPIKGHSILLEALSRLPAGSDKAVLAIAGAGPEESKLRALAIDLGIADRVHLLGFRSDVPDLLHGADIFAMPSRYEGLPMAIIEAMLAGRAIVASDVGGMRELLHDSSVGLLVPPDDATALAQRLSELVRDPGLRGRLGEAARLRAGERFTASAMAERYLAMYTG